MNKKYILGTFIILTSILLTLSFKGSYAKKNNNANILDLNEQNFNENIKEYIDKIDDSLIPTATFYLSNNLNENYDFLAIFALSFINNNPNDFEIIEKEAHKYVKVDDIYKVTEQIFGQKYFAFINDDLEIKDDLILLEQEKNNFSMQIENVEIKDNYNVYVKYKDIEQKYIYEFKDENNKIILYNVKVEEYEK